MKDKILLFKELSGIQTNKQAIQVCDRRGNETGKALTQTDQGGWEVRFSGRSNACTES